MGIFDKLKRKNETHMNDENKKKAIDVLEKVLDAIHRREYQCILDYVDESDVQDIGSLFQFVQETLEMNGYNSLDEYGVPCNFHPAYEYSQLNFYEYNDDSGFALEYDLTSESELVDLCLKMKYLYSKTGIKSIFMGIDPQ